MSGLRLKRSCPQFAGRRMKPPIDRHRSALTGRPGREVGYARPPEHGRFRKGQSGNPKGRPKGARNKHPSMSGGTLEAIILDELYRPVKVRDGERNMTVPIVQAIVRSLAVNAVKGHIRAQRLVTDLATAVEKAISYRNDEWLHAAIAYKFEAEWELERRERLGITGPEIIPHPDQFIIDFDENTARIVGPMTKAEKVIHDGWIDVLSRAEDELPVIKLELLTTTVPDRRDALSREIHSIGNASLKVRSLFPRKPGSPNASDGEERD